jgi:hypothetical protein
MEFQQNDLNDLKKAKILLENPGISAKITNLIGTPIEKGFELLPDIAQSESEDIFSIECKIACLEVFAFGGPSQSDDASESGYFAVRAALAQSVSKAAE